MSCYLWKRPKQCVEWWNHYSSAWKTRLAQLLPCSHECVRNTFIAFINNFICQGRTDHLEVSAACKICMCSRWMRDGMREGERERQIFTHHAWNGPKHVSFIFERVAWQDCGHTACTTTVPWRPTVPWQPPHALSNTTLAVLLRLWTLSLLTFHLFSPLSFLFLNPPPTPSLAF